MCPLDLSWPFLAKGHWLTLRSSRNMRLSVSTRNKEQGQDGPALVTSPTHPSSSPSFHYDTICSATPCPLHMLKGIRLLKDGEGRLLLKAPSSSAATYHFLEVKTPSVSLAQYRLLIRGVGALLYPCFNTGRLRLCWFIFCQKHS